VIVSRDSVRAAVDRALALDPGQGLDTAVAAAAEALGLPVEAVREVIESTDDGVPA
jgi:hypothetical protein